MVRRQKETIMDGLAAILQKHAEELEIERNAHRDALVLCEVYEQRIAELEAARWEPVPAMKPLWSNYRIGSLTTKVRREPPDWFTADSVVTAARIVRDSYEQQRQQDAAMIAALQAENERLRRLTEVPPWDAPTPPEPPATN
jgi:hypothetical protein